MKKQYVSMLLIIAALLLGNFAFSQTTIEGRVTDVLGHPLEGAFVKIKGTSISTKTANDGSFQISSIDNSGRLIFTAPGFYRLNKVYANDTKVEIALHATFSNAPKVVSNGYSSQKKRDIAGSSSAASPKEFATGSGDIRGQLQGRFPGVMVSTTGGVFKVRVRGLTSLYANEPLFVVDNVPMVDVSSLNPDNIESINVLKDASETSIYGTRGATGVIVITTKH